MENEVKNQIAPEEGQEEVKSSKKAFSIVNTILNCLLLVLVILTSIISIAILVTPIKANGEDTNVIAEIIVAFIGGIGKILIAALDFITALFAGIALIPNIVGFVKNKTKYLMAMMIICIVFVVIPLILGILILAI